MPGGHSALAFSIWTAASFVSNNRFIIVSTFILAFLIAQNRISKGCMLYGKLLSVLQPEPR